MKKLFSLLLLFALLLSFASCAAEEAPILEQTFSGDGFSITLNSAFEEKKTEDGTLFVSQNCSVHVIPFESSALEGTSLSPDCSRNDFAQAYLSENYPDATLEEEEALLSFEAADSNESPTVRFRSYFFKNGARFFLLTFSADAISFPAMEPQFSSYARSFTLA